MVAQVDTADLVNAIMSTQALLATDYFQMQDQGALDKLLTDVAIAYADMLRITRDQC